MEFELKGKTVIITGGANGIGSNVVRLLAAEGVKNVTILDIDTKAGVKLQDELNAEHKTEVVKYVQCDVSVENQLFGAFEQTVEVNGCMDVVINNAGLIDESTPEAVRKTIEVNFMALANLTIKALESMRIDRGGKGGTIINVSSVASLCQISPAIFVYMGTKSAILQFSTCIGKPEFSSRTGVRVLTICFGITYTNILDKVRSFDDEINRNQEDLKTIFARQSPENAARGLIEALKIADSGTTWLVANDKPAENITETISKAYGLMAEHLE